MIRNQVVSVKRDVKKLTAVFCQSESCAAKCLSNVNCFWLKESRCTVNESSFIFKLVNMIRRPFVITCDHIERLLYVIVFYWHICRNLYLEVVSNFLLQLAAHSNSDLEMVTFIFIFSAFALDFKTTALYLIAPKIKQK